MTAGRLELVEPDGQVHVLGPGAPPSALIHVRDPRAWTELLRGSRGLASSYVAGHWESSDPTAVVRVAARNAPALDAMRRRLTPVREPYQRLRGVGGSATRSQSREDIRRHYDLGNDLFALMLDETLMYSAAYFETPDTSLHEASIAKLELVCDKLDLHADDHVIEIGAGWGGFALHAATTRGCRVTTTTISAEQHAHATELVARAGLGDRVTVLASDYRDLSGRYTALVSLEMIEAVGWKHFGTFLGKCSDLLEPDGRMLRAGDHHRRPRLRRRKGIEILHPHVDLPERLPPLPAGDRRPTRAPHRPAHGPSRGPHRPLRHNAPALAAQHRDPRRSPHRARLRRALPAPLAHLPLLLRGRLRRAAHRSRTDAARQAALDGAACPSPSSPDPPPSAPRRGASRTPRSAGRRATQAGPCATVAARPPTAATSSRSPDSTASRARRAPRMHTALIASK